MANYFSKPYLREIRDEFIRTKSSFALNEAMNQRTRAKFVSEVSVFLSHKHDERYIIEQTVAFFKALNVTVYLDWLDEGMPKSTSGTTAKRIKEKISVCKKFILLATEGAIASKWCNWELGIGDVKKYPQHIAVMPITESKDNRWSGNEYLQIYPIIRFDYNISDSYVELQGKRERFSNWLKQ